MRQEKEDWIDVTVAVTPDMVLWPGDPEVRIERLADVECGDHASISRLELGAHTGTHVDAPGHLLPQGEMIDALPPARLIGPARVLAIRDREKVSAAELERHRLRPGERILLKTCNSSRRQQARWIEDSVYLSKEAADLLVARKVAAVGIDALSVDPFDSTAMPAHRILLGGGVWIIENLDFTGVAPGDYDLICLPLRLQGCEAAPARALLRPRAAGGKLPTILC